MPEGVPPDRAAELLSKRSQASREEVLRLLSSVSSEQELISKVGPVFDRLPDNVQQQVIQQLREIKDKDLERSFRVGAEATLRDLNAILNLSEHQLKAITIAAAYFIASDEQERARLIDPERFIAQAGYSQGADVNRTAVRLITSYYLHNLTVSGSALFSHPAVRGVVAANPAASEEGISAIRRAVAAAQYTPQDVKRICKAVHAQTSKAIEETYANLGKTLRLRSEFTKAAMRTSARGLSWVLLLIVLTDFHLPSFSDWFRKTSREFEREAIEQVYDRYDRTVARITAQQFSSVPVDVFNQEKAALQKALAEQHTEHQDVVSNFCGVIVAPSDDVNEEIKRVIKNEKVLEGIRNTAQRWWESLAGRIAGTAEWSKFAVNQRQGFEREVYDAIDKLFRDEQFLVALEKDKKSGIIEVQVSSNWAMKYVDRGLYWTTSTAKEAAQWAAEKSLATLLQAIGELFKQTANYAYGTITQNDQRLDEAQRYFAHLAALTGGMAAVLMLLLIFAGPWLLAALQIIKATVKWSIKGGVLFYKVMISGAIKDVIIITGTARIASLAEPIESAKATVSKRPLLDRLFHK